VTVARPDEVPCPACGASRDQSTNPANLRRAVCFCGHPRYFDYKHLDGTCPCLQRDSRGS
jgi:hypothetical protein